VLIIYRAQIHASLAKLRPVSSHACCCCTSFRQVATRSFYSENDNDVSWGRAMIVLGIGAIAIAIITLASFSLLLHSTDTRRRGKRIF
jgi:hypothetical protein